MIIKIILILSITLSLYAHENCTDSLSQAYKLYDKAMMHVENKADKNAKYYAKRFQFKAYEFSLVCKDEYHDNKRVHTYKRIVKGFNINELSLFDKGYLKNKMLTQ